MNGKEKCVPKILQGGIQLAPEYPEQLINFGVSMEERSFCNHLGKDAGNAPDIDRAGVALTTEQHLRSTVPQSHDLVSIENV